VTRPCVRPRQAKNHATTCPASRQHHHWCSNRVGRQWRNWELGGPWTNIQVKPFTPFSYIHSFFCSLSTPSTVASRLLCRCVCGTILARPTRRSQSCSPRDRGLGLGLGTAGLSLEGAGIGLGLFSSGAARGGKGRKLPPYGWTSKNYVICVCTAVNVSASGGLRTLDPLQTHTSLPLLQNPGGATALLPFLPLIFSPFPTLSCRFRLSPPSYNG